MMMGVQPIDAIITEHGLKNHDVMQMNRGGLTRAECNGRKEKSEKEDFDGRFALHGKLSPIQKSLLPVAERVPNHQPPRREGCRYKGAWIAAGLPTEEEPRLCNSS